MQLRDGRAHPEFTREQATRTYSTAQLQTSTWSRLTPCDLKTMASSDTALSHCFRSSFVGAWGARVGLQRLFSDPCPRKGSLPCMAKPVCACLMYGQQGERNMLEPLPIVAHPACKAWRSASKSCAPELATRTPQATAIPMLMQTTAHKGREHRDVWSE